MCSVCECICLCACARVVFIYSTVCLRPIKRVRVWFLMSGTGWQRPGKTTPSTSVLMCTDLCAQIRTLMLIIYIKFTLHYKLNNSNI